MREILEDAHEHMQDGIGRAEAATRPKLPKRFYKAAEVVENESGFGIALDGRLIKTPSKKPVIVPNREIAEFVKVEWAAQVDEIDARIMPHTRLVNAAVEGGEKVAQDLRDEIVKYAGNDAMLFRADTPQELVDEQERVWDTILAKLASEFELKFLPVVGIIHKDQPQSTLDKISKLLTDLDYVSLTALMSITNLTGSGLLSLALLKGHETPDAVWDAAHVDEDHNARLWGEDFEAKARREKRRIEFDAAVNVLNASLTR